MNTSHLLLSSASIAQIVCPGKFLKTHGEQLYVSIKGALSVNGEAGRLANHLPLKKP